MQVTKNGGKTWFNVKKNIDDIPEKIWVSRVVASNHKKGRAYVTFDNHRYDDNKPYVYRTDNFGKSWKNITANLPEKYSTYVIKEDYENSNLLFVGTEATVHTSLDGGESWATLNKNLPTVAVHDLVIPVSYTHLRAHEPLR